jgi:hypothetical protein
MISKLLPGTLVVVFLVASCGGTAAEEKSPPPPSVSVSFPNVVIPPGVEKTECVVLRLGNTSPLRVGTIHNTLGPGSHHLVVYRVTDAEEKPTPFECTPFVDTLDPTKGSPLIVTQKSDDRLELPHGVAYTLDPHQMVRLEMHYINPSSAPKTITATTTLISISPDDYRDEADFLFIGNPDIRIPPRSVKTLGPTFFQIPSDIGEPKFFAMTGHEHQFGTNVQVAVTSGRDDPGTMVYDVPDWKWNEPKTEVFATPLTVPPGGGFRFTCTWNNTSDQQVGFGESAMDEMCFFWAYYYPSHGPKVCVHTKRVGGAEGVSICCPGHPFCGASKEFFTNQK